MTEQETPRSRGGRPEGPTGQAKKLRTLRMGPLWEQGQAMAKARGVGMTALVEEALRRELARLERQDRRQASA